MGVCLQEGQGEAGARCDPTEVSEEVCEPGGSEKGLQDVGLKASLINIMDSGVLYRL